MQIILKQIIEHLQSTQALYEVIEEAKIVEEVKALQTWQTQRLLHTHNDFWCAKRFNPAMQFFIDELYGPKDFSQRDTEIARVVPKMAKVLPEKGLVSLEAALHLNSLSLELDITLVACLKGKTLNSESYFDAYRQSNNKVQREQQLGLLENLGQDLAQVVKITGISTLLTLSRRPAQLAGVSSLHEFLENGFNAFKKLGNVSDFIDPIIAREKEIMEALFSATDQSHNPLPKIDDV